MRNVLILSILFAFTHADLGPCRRVFPVHTDICKWPTQMYLNMYTQDLGQTCSWVNRYLNYTNDGQILFAEQYRRLVTSTCVHAEVVASLFKLRPRKSAARDELDSVVMYTSPVRVVTAGEPQG
ncbi:hypothetical protein J6590_045128 [Homalodisca vitripennis]|nr:hypothetical protein J6590_045124 [Homalodisca vitripennis]KAG8252930.1 hypothetical protein J6590_045128 [Homalodisca vitripennis]